MSFGWILVSFMQIKYLLNLLIILDQDGGEGQ